MAEKDALGNLDVFDQFSGAGLFLKWKANVPYTLRILTTDPVVSQTEFPDKQKPGEVTLNTKFNFIVYNFTENKAQILGATPAMARKFGELHVDQDFGANIRNIDIKVTPTGEGLERRYDIQVLPNTRQLTAEMVKEAQSIALDDLVNDSKGRMSEFNQNMAGKPVGSGGSEPAENAPEVGNGGEPEGSGYAKAKAVADGLKPSTTPAPEDVVIEDIGDEPINLDDIPF